MRVDVDAPEGLSSDAARRRADALSRRRSTGYASTSVLGRASRPGVVELLVHDFRDATTDVHRRVDDAPFGGGAGMVLRAEPILRTVEATPDLAATAHRPDSFGAGVHARRRERDSRAWTGFTLLCGRYEGFDQRALDLVVDDELSLGDFVLAGGELAALW